MKICPTCNAQLQDDATFCSECGTPIANAVPNQAAANQQAYAYAPPAAPNSAPATISPYNHTSDFTAKDTSDNKCFAMLIYLFPLFGTIIALLAANDSDYLKFHTRQGIKIFVTKLLCTLIMIIPIIGTFIGGVCAIVIFVVQLICFFQVCSGESNEAPIIRSIGFLK